MVPDQMCCHSNLNVFRKSLRLYKGLLQVKAWKQADGIYLCLSQFLALQIVLTSVGVSCPSHWTFEPNNQFLWTLSMTLYPIIREHECLSLSNRVSEACSIIREDSKIKITDHVNHVTILWMCEWFEFWTVCEQSWLCFNPSSKLQKAVYGK